VLDCRADPKSDGGGTPPTVGELLLCSFYCVDLPRPTVSRSHLSSGTGIVYELSLIFNGLLRLPYL
jgi:hypothetical protein